MNLIRVIVLLLFAMPALAQRPIEFSTVEWPEDGSIVIPAAEGEALTGLAAELDKRTGGAIAMAASEVAFRGEKGQTLTLLGIKPYARIDLIGVGPDPVDRVGAEDFGGLAAGVNDGKSGTTVQILWSGVPREDDATAARVAFGYRLGDYRFDRYQQERLDPAERGKVVVLSDESDAADQFADDLEHVAAGVYLARDLSSEPGNIIYPQSFVDRVSAEFAGLKNVNIRVLDEKDLRRLGAGAHLGVGGGSSRPPRLLVIEYFAGGDRPTLVLAGKGITFDSGGVSLKPGKGMWMMKGDMTGAAVVSSTVLAAARRGAPVNVVALAALAENLPSGTAIRPGDVLTSMSGKTIEIDSTDAEGRLLLIDVATLTGSVGRAVGPDYAGLFSLEDELANGLLEAGAVSGEEVWRLPLNDTYFEQIKSEIADVKNGGAGGAGASVGAAFIGSFVGENQAWAHIDIAGVDYNEEPEPTKPKGFTGWGVRLLDEYLRRHFE